MTRIEDFSDAARDFIDDIIDRQFPDAVPVLEKWFDGMTRSQFIFFEQYWRENGPRDTPARAVWEAIQRAHERPLKPKQKQSRFRKETVTI